MVFVPRPFPERLRERLTSFVEVRHHREAPDGIAWAFHTIRGSFEEASWPVTVQPFPGPWGKGLPRLKL